MLKSRFQVVRSCTWPCVQMDAGISCCARRFPTMTDGNHGRLAVTRTS